MKNKSLVLFVSLLMSGLAGCHLWDANHEGLQEKRIVRGTNVRIRSAPAVDSKIVAVLQGGDLLQPLEKTEDEITIEDLTGPWFRIRVDSGPEQGKEGWIFGPLTVSYSMDPYSQIYEVYEMENHQQAIEELQRIIRDYPRFPEIGMNHYEAEARAEIGIRRCWLSRIGSGAESPGVFGAESREELMRRVRSAINENQPDDLLPLLSCAFILMEGACAGGPLYYAPGENTARRIVELGRKTDWRQTGENCYGIPGNGQICLAPVEVKGKHYIDFVCTEALAHP